MKLSWKSWKKIIMALVITLIMVNSLFIYYHLDNQIKKIHYYQVKMDISTNELIHSSSFMISTPVIVDKIKNNSQPFPLSINSRYGNMTYQVEKQGNRWFCVVEGSGSISLGGGYYMDDNEWQRSSYLIGFDNGQGNISVNRTIGLSIGEENASFNITVMWSAGTGVSNPFRDLVAYSTKSYGIYNSSEIVNVSRTLESSFLYPHNGGDVDYITYYPSLVNRVGINVFYSLWVATDSMASLAVIILFWRYNNKD